MRDNNDYSPSLVHERLLKEVKPSHAFDPGDVAGWRQRLKRKHRTLIGYDRMPSERCELNVREVWQRDVPGGTIRRLVFTSEPGADVPAYLCTPDSHSGDRPPVFICLQGHSPGMAWSIGCDVKDETTPVEAEGDRDYALGCLKRGIASLCIEQRGFGMRKEKHWGKGKEGWQFTTCHQASMNALLLGRTLLAERVYDVDRGIDLLEAVGGFDLSRLGVMGNSGGGLVTIHAAALLPRVKLAMPSCGFCELQQNIVPLYHCVDNYVPGMLHVARQADFMGLFAPKPVIIVAGRDDHIFPLPGVREAFRGLKEIYEAHDAGKHCKLVVGQGGHDFYADAAWKAMLPFVEP